ncbi:hypothetical protein LLG95_06255 [bacterium]|nr:hypothetical protein [bacterium]
MGRILVLLRGGANVLLLGVFMASAALAQTFNPDAWVVNGPVYRILPTPNAIYIAGDFTHIGPDFSGGAVPLDLATGDHLAVFPKVNGIVNTCIPDGSGGWFLGGSFDQVGTYVRTNLAHILADGTVDPAWNTNTASSVYAMVLAGSTLYIGGQMTYVNGEMRQNLASLNASSGALLPWAPNPNQTVYALAATSSTLYVGGEFTSLSGTSRTQLASFDLASGAITDWSPSISAPSTGGYPAVRVLLVSGSTLYAGGRFAGGNLAAFNLTQPTRAYDLPAIGGENYDDVVYALAISGSTLFVGGGFTKVNGLTHNMLAAVSATSNVVQDWNPGADNSVWAITVVGSKVYAGGYFRKIGGECHPGIVQIDSATTATTPIQCDPSGSILTLAVAGSTMYIGGRQLMVDGVRRVGLAALVPATCRPTAWVSDIDGGVWAMALSGSRLYLGGYFTQIGGKARKNIGAVDISTGEALDWDPSADQPVNAIAVSGSTVYIGGYFNNAGGQPRLHLAALAAASGQATAWNHDLVNRVYSLAADSSGVFAGCDWGVLSMNHTTGQTKWLLSTDNNVNCVALSGSTLFVGGQFINIGHMKYSGLTGVDAATGSFIYGFPTATDYYPLYGMSSMAVSGSLLGVTNIYNVFLLAVTGETLADIHFDGGTSAVGIQGSNLYAGGGFHTVNGYDRPNFAMFTLPNASRHWMQYK